MKALPYDVVSEQSNRMVALPGDYCRLSLPAAATVHRFIFCALPTFLGVDPYWFLYPNGACALTYQRTSLLFAWQRAKLIFSRNGEDVLTMRMDRMPDTVEWQWYQYNTVTRNLWEFSPRMIIRRDGHYTTTQGWLTLRENRYYQAKVNCDNQSHDPLTSPDQWQPLDQQPWTRRGNRCYDEFDYDPSTSVMDSFPVAGRHNGEMSTRNPNARAIFLAPGDYLDTFAPIVFLDSAGRPAVQGPITNYQSMSQVVKVDWRGLIAPAFETVVSGSFDAVRLHVEDTAPFVTFDLLLNVVSTVNLPPDQDYEFD